MGTFNVFLSSIKRKSRKGRSFLRQKFKPDPFDWVVESLIDEPSFFQKSMFGCLAYYLFGKLVLVTAKKEKPWNGLLVPTEKIHHASLIQEIPSLKAHPVLGKWLYLPESTENFEESAGNIIFLIQSSDPRMGVEPDPKSQR